MNVHKRCQKNVANNCGIDTKQLADILQEMGVVHTKERRKRVNNFLNFNLLFFLIVIKILFKSEQ